MVLYDTLISLCLAPNLISCSHISHLLDCLISFGYICIKVREETYNDPGEIVDLTQLLKMTLLLNADFHPVRNKA